MSSSWFRSTGFSQWRVGSLPGTNQLTCKPQNWFNLLESQASGLRTQKNGWWIYRTVISATMLWLTKTHQDRIGTVCAGISSFACPSSIQLFLVPIWLLQLVLVLFLQQHPFLQLFQQDNGDWGGWVQLQAALIQEWRDVPQQLIWKLVQSMCRCVTGCLTSRRGHTLH